MLNLKILITIYKKIPKNLVIIYNLTHLQDRYTKVKYYKKFMKDPDPELTEK
jgi:hypothetical protein